MMLGDIHYGAPNCLIDRVRENINKCIKEGIYVATMGDLIESANRYSVGESVYTQLNPQQQIDDMVNLLKPLVKKGLLLNILGGNHESRIKKLTGLDVNKIIADSLHVHHSGLSQWFNIKVGKQEYSMYTLHGYGNSKTLSGKLNQVKKISETFNCDVVAQGHVHDLCNLHKIEKILDEDKIITKEKYLVITGSYLDYNNSYAEELGLSIGKIGSPIITFTTSGIDITNI